MTTPSNRKRDLMLSREPNATSDIRNSRTAHDYPRSAVNHRVVNPAGNLIPVVTWLKSLAAKPGNKLLHRSIFDLSLGDHIDGVLRMSGHGPCRNLFP
jgi:hypothetical protein